MEQAFERRERGGAKIKAVLSLLILIAMVFSAVRIVPAYVNNYNLQDDMQDEARFASVYNKRPSEIQRDIEKKADELRIPLKADAIQVSVSMGRVSISTDYVVTVDLAVYQLHIHFHPQADNSSL